MTRLDIKDLSVEVDGKPILNGVTLDVEQGKVHALMGPNGSGKSTLAYAIAGHPAYRVTGGSIELDGVSLTEQSPDQRSRAGLFLAMQYPTEVPGVSVTNFLRTSLNAHREVDVPVREFLALLKAEMARLEFDEKFLDRSINQGFSGGEKKRFEILQLALLKPHIAVLDETDSGLDVDALRVVAEGINEQVGPDLGVLLITHYTRILRYIKPDVVHVMFEGRIVQTGGPELADELEAEGYEHLRPATVGA